jgi:hypothetical protein
LGRSWVFFNKAVSGIFHELMTKKFNAVYCGDSEEGHSIGFQFGGDGKRSNLQLESNNVNHGIKYAIEMLIRALIRAGYKLH